MHANKEYQDGVTDFTKPLNEIEKIGIKIWKKNKRIIKMVVNKLPRYRSSVTGGKHK